MTPKEVFLSHSSTDRKIAENVANTLRNHGVPVWFSPTNIKTAYQWQEEIGKALRRCDWFAVLLSIASVKSKWVKMELHYALNHSQYDNHILPVIIERCEYEELSWTLSLFQTATINGADQQGFADLLGAWGLGFDPSNMDPRYRMETDKILAILRRKLRRGRHSYDWIRKHTSLTLTDEEFDKLIQDHPDVLKKAPVKRKDESGIYVRGGKRGMTLTN